MGTLTEQARAGRETGLRELVAVLQDRIEIAAPTVVAQLAGQLRLALHELHGNGWMDVNSYRVSLSAVRDYLTVAAEKMQDSDKPGADAVLVQIAAQLRAVLALLGNLPAEDKASTREKLRLVVGG